MDKSPTTLVIMGTSFSPQAFSLQLPQCIQKRADQSEREKERKEEIIKGRKKKKEEKFKKSKLKKNIY